MRADPPAPERGRRTGDRVRDFGQPRATDAAVRPRPRRPARAATFVVLVSMLAASAPSSDPAAARSEAPPLPGLAPAPAHARLFAPPFARERHDAWSTDRSIDEVARACRARWPSAARGSWQVAIVPPLEAVDAAAPVSRWRLARVYRGRRVRLARGPVVAAGVVVASLTLLSPYPDAQLRRLLPGTLVIRTWIPAELWRR
jgi:hypothetical protein